MDNVGDDGNQTEEHNDETSEKSKKRFGLFRLSGRKSKSAKDGSKDSLKSQSRDSVDFEITGSELSPEGRGSKEASKPREVAVDANENIEKISFVTNAVISNDAEAGRTVRKASLPKEEISSPVQSEMTSNDLSAVFSAASNTNSEGSLSLAAGERQKESDSLTSGGNTPSSANDLVWEEDIKTTEEQAEGTDSVRTALGSGDISEIGVVEEATDPEIGIEGLILPTRKANEKNAFDEDGRPDEKDEVGIGEAGLTLEYPEKEIEDKKQHEEVQERNLVALTRDDETANLIQEQIKELHKLKTGREDNWKLHMSLEGRVSGEGRDRVPFDDEVKIKKSYEQRVTLNQSTPRLSSFDYKETGFTSGTVGRNTITNTTSIRSDLPPGFESRSFHHPTVTESLILESQLKFHVVSGIKEVKKYSPVLLARLKKINKKLVELRSELLNLKDSGKDEAMNGETEHMPLPPEIPKNKN